MAVSKRMERDCSTRQSGHRSVLQIPETDLEFSSAVVSESQPGEESWLKTPCTVLLRQSHVRTNDK